MELSVCHTKDCIGIVVVAPSPFGGSNQLVPGVCGVRGLSVGVCGLPALRSRLMGGFGGETDNTVSDRDSSFEADTSVSTPWL